MTAPSVLLRRRRPAEPGRGRRPEPAPAARRRPRAPEQFTGWGFVTPGAAIILLFWAVPIVWSVVMFFQRSNLLSPSISYVGFCNYRVMAHDLVVV